MISTWQTHITGPLSKCKTWITSARYCCCCYCCCCCCCCCCRCCCCCCCCSCWGSCWCSCYCRRCCSGSSCSCCSCSWCCCCCWTTIGIHTKDIILMNCLGRLALLIKIAFLLAGTELKTAAGGLLLTMCSASPNTLSVWIFAKIIQPSTRDIPRMVNVAPWTNSYSTESFVNGRRK